MNLAEKIAVTLMSSGMVLALVAFVLFGFGVVRSLVVVLVPSGVSVAGLLLLVSSFVWEIWTDE